MKESSGGHLDNKRRVCSVSVSKVLHLHTEYVLWFVNCNGT